MKILVESLKRLYQSGKISFEKIQEIYVKSQITLEEYRYILNEN